MLAIALSLVLLISTAVLLYQFWAGSLLGDESLPGDGGTLHAITEERGQPAPPPAFRADTAA